MSPFLYLLSILTLALPTTISAQNVSTQNNPHLTPITLQLMWKHQFEFAGFYAAKAKGYYQQAGLDVNFKEYGFGDNIVDEVVSGRAQYGIRDSSLIIDRSEGKPVVLLSSIFQHSPMVLISKNESGIISPAQMIGKKVMLASHELSNASIIAMLDKESVSLEQLQVIEHSFNIDDLIDGKVDVMSAYASNQPSVFKQRNIAINIIKPINFGIDFYGNGIFTSEQHIRDNPQQTKDFIAASLKGWQYALEHPEEIIDLILTQYNSQNKSRGALQFEAKILSEYILPQFIPLGTIDPLRLTHIVNTYQQLNLIDTSFSLDGFLNSNISQKALRDSLFSAQERTWINNKEELILGVDPNWKPFEFINEQQQYVGMAADFIRLVAQKIGLPIKVQNNTTWADVMSSAKSKNLDVLPAVMHSTRRDQFLDFTSPHIVYPMVIVTHKNASFISQLNDLKGETVVVVDGYVTEDLIRQNHSSLNLVTAQNIDDALTMVSNDDATAFVDNLGAINTAISKGGFTNLRISGTTQYKFELSFGVPKGEKLLLSILQKALDDISESERNSIKNKWISLTYTKQTDHTLVYQIIAVAIIFILMVMAWNRRLTKEVNSRKAAELKAQESEKRFRMLFEDNKAIELIIDPDNGKIIEANHSAMGFYGYSLDELLSKNIKEINCLTDAEIQRETELAKRQQRTHFYFKHRLSDGSIRDVEVHSGPVQWDNKELLYSIIHDVTHEKELQFKLAEKATELEYQASHDALTGLINRREFELRLNNAISYCKKQGNCTRTILALDLDNFKVVNDTAGHAVGDDVLKKISQIMLAKVRERDTFARLGGDEFGAILDNCSINDAQDVAQSIIKAVKDFHYQWEDDYTFHLGVSIGIAPIACDGATLDMVLNQADAACYEAKRLGRNRAQVYSPDNTLASRRQGERWWTNEILSAIEEDRFSLYHQTILPIATHNQQEGNQFEVLLRLHDVAGNLVFPDNFIPAAEHYQLMPMIDRWVIENTFIWLAYHPVALNDLQKCSINLSGQSITDKDFYDDVIEQFHLHGIPANKICWEITETAAIADFDKAKEFISLMRDYGCSFSLDDFGSGLSSFNYLKHLDVDFIKIDGAFIKDILSNPKDQLIVESIRTISQGLKMQTIAEFVENDDIKQRLIELNIDYAQGYGIHKPSPLK